jgi:hypothetical protein
MGSGSHICAKGGGNKEEELKLSSYCQKKIVIGSYTRGLKTRLKEVMSQNSVGGYITKTVYTTPDDMHSTPIHTEVVVGGTFSNVEEFAELAKEVVEENIDFEVTAPPMLELSEEEKKKVVIRKTDDRIFNRKTSDAGEDNSGNENLLDQAVLVTNLVTNKVRNRAKQVFKVVSGIPILSQYTNDINEQFSVLVTEMPKELISAKSLFHPFSVCSFTMYKTDELSVLKICIEWKLGIPYDSLDLFTLSGVPMTDTYTLMKDKQCVFADKRVTRRFFATEQELKSVMQKIIQEPFVYHKIALHGMSMQYLIKTFGGIKEKMAQEIIQGDLGISGVAALKLVKFIQKS